MTAPPVPPATPASHGLAWGAGRAPSDLAAQFASSLANLSRFFMGDADAQRALHKLTAILEADGTPYAIIGAFALGAYGHQRATIDVDLILRDDDLQAFKRKHLGRGYAERVAGTGKLLDTEFNVKVDVLSTGRFPGDGQPKPIAFPDPVTTAIRGDSFALLPLPRFIELKLASGMTAPHRLHDLADVLNLVRLAGLPAELEYDLHPWCRDKFRELWIAAQGQDPPS